MAESAEDRALREAEEAQHNKSADGTLTIPGLGQVPSGSGGRAPIGVEDGYTANVPHTRRGLFGVPKGFTTTQKVPPRYFVGDELRPRRNNWTGAQIADLQQKMVSAGLLKKGTFQLGVWDDSSIAAYEKLLAYANASGRDATQELNDISLNREKFGSPEDEQAKRAPLVLTTTHPDDIRGTFREATKKMLGRALDDAELEKFISAYNQVEEAKQREQYALSDPEGAGGSMQTIPDAATFIEEKLRKERPVDVAATAVNDRASEFFGLLGAFDGGD